MDAPEIRYIDHFVGARDAGAPGARLTAVRSAAERLHAELRDGPRAAYYRAFDLIRVPYPTKYGLRDACSVPTPLLHILNRMLVVQYKDVDGQLRTLLVSPSDPEANRETPFFKRLGSRASVLGARGEAMLAPTLGTVEGALAELGLRPEDIDYITYDHLHTQDVRRWLGGTRDGVARPGYFPRAKLLVMRQEWVSAGALLPTQQDWYCPDGLLGVPEDRVVLLDGSVRLGDGVLLMHTPGHTEGNHSIVVVTDDGPLVTSENGICADAFSPLASDIPGVRRYAQDTGAEVILNGNTLEGSVDQYISMVQEKTVAGPSPRNPSFFNVVPSSELTPYWMFPGIKPTFGFGAMEFGAATVPGAR